MRWPTRQNRLRVSRAAQLESWISALVVLTIAAKRFKNSCWAGWIFASAAGRVNHPARSTSGNSCFFPDFGGHSIENELLRIASASQSPSTAHAVITLPELSLISDSKDNSPIAGANPVSSWNSLFAAASGSSPVTYSPFGIDQAPRSFFDQYGPPG